MSFTVRGHEEKVRTTRLTSSLLIYINTHTNSGRFKLKNHCRLLLNRGSIQMEQIIPGSKTHTVFKMHWQRENTYFSINLQRKKMWGKSFKVVLLTLQLQFFVFFFEGLKIKIYIFLNIVGDICTTIVKTFLVTFLGISPRLFCCKIKLFTYELLLECCVY